MRFPHLQVRGAEKKEIEVRKESHGQITDTAGVISLAWNH